MRYKQLVAIFLINISRMSDFPLLMVRNIVSFEVSFDSGALAQLVERLAGSQKVSGSTPLGSTSTFSAFFHFKFLLRIKRI